MAQTVPWVTPMLSAKSSSLVINCIPKIYGKALSAGDYIGAFNDSGKCFGLAQWKDSTNTIIVINGTNGTTDGFKDGEHISFKLWIYKENCIVENAPQILADSPLVFGSSVSNKINFLNFQRVTISYTAAEYCLNQTDIDPQFNYSVNDLSFSSDPGLNINSSTGTIIPAKSSPGIYSVLLNSQYCLTSKTLNLTLKDIPHISNLPDTFICGEKLTLSIPVGFSEIDWSTGAKTSQIDLTETTTLSYTIKNTEGCSNSDTFSVKKIAIAQVDYTVEKADCYQQGKLDLLNQQITNGKPPYTYKLTNQIDNSEINSLYNVPEGIYKMEIINSNGCALNYQKKIIIEKDCLNDKPVFTPNEDGLDDKFFINLEGDIRIFDRNGTLKRKLTGPCYFDGYDSNGKSLPMGTYLIVSQHGKNITLTIVR